jgi:hypothetical protein
MCDNVVWETTHAGIDVASRGCLIRMAAGTKLAPNLHSTQGTSSYGESTIRGYLYSPAQGVQVAWSVHNSDNPISVNGQVTYPIVNVNVGPTSPWQATTNTVIIPTSGYYYIEVASETKPGPADMRVVLNGAVTISRVLLGFSADWVGRSRSVLMQLHTGDQLVVTCTSCTISGDGNQGVSFMGVLLYQTTW